MRRMNTGKTASKGTTMASGNRQGHDYKATAHADASGNPVHTAWDATAGKLLTDRQILSQMTKLSKACERRSEKAERLVADVLRMLTLHHDHHETLDARIGLRIDEALAECNACKYMCEVFRALETCYDGRKWIRYDMATIRMEQCVARLCTVLHRIAAVDTILGYAHGDGKRGEAGK